MFAVTLKGLLGHKLRFVLTALSISLGVAFLAGTMIYTATIRRTFDDMLADTNEHLDALVRSTENTETPYGDQRARIDQSVAEVVRSVPGVGAVSAGVSGYTQLVGKDGKALGGFGPPTLGISWPADDRLSSYTVVDGRAPGQGEVVIDRASYANGHFALGDQVKVLTRAGPSTYTLVGTVRYGSADSPAGATLAFFDFATAQQLVGEPGKVDDVSVMASEGVSREELRDRIQAALPPGQHLETITGDQLVAETQDAIAQGMSFFGTFMLVFAFIALFVATFIINNTFSILVAQRTRELALLRAVGASRAQVLGSVAGEAVLLGALASIVGLGLGVALAYGLKGLMSLAGFNLPTSGLAIPPSTILLSIAVGVVVTVIAAALPARRAARIAPMAALQASSTEPPTNRPVRAVVGVVLLAGGALTMAAALLWSPDDALKPVAFGALASFLGVAALAPVLSRPVSRVLGAPLARVRGEVGHLAQQNAMRNPRRTSATASALMVGVALVATITILAASSRASVEGVIDQAMRSDFMVTPTGAGGFGPSGFSPEVRAKIAALPEVAVASPVRAGLVKIAGQASGVAAIDPPTFTQVIDLGRVNGDLGRLGAHTIAVSEKAAQEHGWHLGDRIPVDFSTERHETLELVATYERREAVTDELISIATAKEQFRDDLDYQLVVKLAPGVDTAAGKQAVAAVTDQYANLQLLDQTQYKQQIEGTINQMLGLVYALLFLSVIIALIGIANTLALSVHERVHELGLLRALGMTQRQVRTSVRYESVIIALLGAALGIALGCGFGVAVTLAMRSEGISTLVLPVAELVIIAVLASLAGVLASVSPARRAAHTDILRAVATE